MFWVLLYGALALVTAACLSVAADRLSERGVSEPRHVGALTVVGGLLWPLLSLGTAQLVVVVGLRRLHLFLAARTGPAEPIADPIPGMA